MVTDTYIINCKIYGRMLFYLLTLYIKQLVRRKVVAYSKQLVCFIIHFIRPDFMKIDIHALNFDADEAFLKSVYNRIQTFGKYSDKLTGADVYLKKENDTDNEGASKKVEIRLHGAGPDIHADDESDNFEAALNQTYQKIMHQLKKYRK